MTYQITLAQLDALALCISNMDGRTDPKSNQVNAEIAHNIISYVLGDDVTKLYADIENEAA
jgi:hypothetical protein